MPKEACNYSLGNPALVYYRRGGGILENCELSQPNLLVTVQRVSKIRDLLILYPFGEMIILVIGQICCIHGSQTYDSQQNAGIGIDLMKMIRLEPLAYPKKLLLK